MNQKSILIGNWPLYFRLRRVLCAATILNLTQLAGPAFAQLQIQIPGPELDIMRRGEQLIINWDERRTTGVLQVGNELSGPWAEIIGAKAPYSTSARRAHRFYRLGPGSKSDPTGSFVETFAARAESSLGTWVLMPQSDWMSTRGQSWTHIRSGARPEPPVYRSMSGHFLAPQDGTPVAIFFSA